MKSIFRATAILSSSSIASIFLGLVSAKVLATYLQPAGYGYYGLLQSFVGLASLVTGMGIGTALVRMGAGAVTHQDQVTISSLRTASWLVLGGLGSLALLTLGLFVGPIGRWTVGSSDHTGTIMLMGIALLFTVAANIQSGTLNAYHRIEALAKCGVASAVLAAGVSIVAVLIWRVQGIVPAIIGGAVVSWAISGYVLRHDVGPVRVRPTRRETLTAVWSLLRFGGPYTASMLVGTGVQLALPIVVLHLLSAESVGFYKAASAISVGYLGFLVTAMAQDYYPRVSAVADQPGALVKLINEQHRLVMILVVPMILGTLAVVPYLVPLVYSHKFISTVEILEWQLVGDLFKFSSWTMSFIILARCRSSVFFLSELIAGAANLLMTWLAVRWFGLPGLGIGFLATYIIYYVVVWLIVRREIPLVWTSSNKIMMLASLAAASVIRILPSTAWASFRTVIALSLATLAGVWSLYAIRHELGFEKRITALRRVAVKI
jgi:PST family polysaccharide transporter